MNFTGNTSKYDRQKTHVLIKFFNALYKNRSLSVLTVKSKKTGDQHFFTLTAFKTGSAVMKIINNAMCCWGNTLVMDKYTSENLEEMEEKDFHDAQYEPNSVVTIYTFPPELG